jgi:hypothetical protein
MIMHKELTANGFAYIRNQVTRSGSIVSPITVEGFEVVEELELKLAGNNFPKLTFTRCTFERPLIVRSTSGFQEIEFDHCIFQDAVTFEMVVSKVSWKECHFKAQLTFNGGQAALSLRGFDIEGNLEILGNYTGILTIEGINYSLGRDPTGLENLSILRGLCGGLTIKECKFKEINFGNNRVLGNDCHLEKVEIVKLTLMHLEIGNWLYVRESKIAYVVVDNLRQNHRYIQFSYNCLIEDLSVALHMVDQLELFECQVGSLLLKGTNSKSGITTIRTPDIRELKFDAVFNEGRLTFIGIVSKRGSKLCFLSSNLGKTDFIACDFMHAELEFKNSKVSEIFLAEVNFPREVVSAGEADYGQTELLFGQLTTAAERQGHTAWAF